jgi:hypothetical protein
MQENAYLVQCEGSLDEADAKNSWGVTPNPGYGLPLNDMEREHLSGYLDDKLIFRHPGGQGIVCVDRQVDFAATYLRKLLDQS